jgi:hypothetical protein
MPEVEKRSTGTGTPLSLLPEEITLASIRELRSETSSGRGDEGATFEAPETELAIYLNQAALPDPSAKRLELAIARRRSWLKSRRPTGAPPPEGMARRNARSGSAASEDTLYSSIALSPLAVTNKDDPSVVSASLTGEHPAATRAITASRLEDGSAAW